MNPPPPSRAADRDNGEQPEKKRKPRKTTFQKYKSPICFLLFTCACAFALYCTAASGYFERHMDEVRHAAADRFLSRQRSFPNASVLPSGLIFSILERGSGERAPAADDVCEIHYLGQYRFPEVFEDTHQGSYPVRRSPSQFIPGVAEALQLMREGDKWSLVVPYFLAYGTEGNEALHLPSFVNLRYTVELLRCPEGPTGRTSEEIDRYLQPHLKEPMPERKAEEPHSDL